MRNYNKPTIYDEIIVIEDICADSGILEEEVADVPDEE